jgi:hypothetical protein
VKKFKVKFDPLEVILEGKRVAPKMLPVSSAFVIDSSIMVFWGRNFWYGKLRGRTRVNSVFHDYRMLNGVFTGISGNQICSPSRELSNGTAFLWTKLTPARDTAILRRTMKSAKNEKIGLFSAVNRAIWVSHFLWRVPNRGYPTIHMPCPKAPKKSEKIEKFGSFCGV